MKINISFESEEKSEIMGLLKSGDYVSSLDEIYIITRGVLKHSEPKSESVEDLQTYIEYLKSVMDKIKSLASVIHE